MPQDPKPTDTKPAVTAGEQYDKSAGVPGTSDQVKAQAAAEFAAEQERHKGLVKMVKGDDTLRVHPTAVADHEAVGWTRD